MALLATIGVILPVAAAAITGLGWGRRRLAWWRQRRSLPGDLRLTFERAVGDPGFFLTIENFRALPVRIKAWGVMDADDVPKGHKPKLVPLAGIPTWAWSEQGVWAEGDEIVPPLTSWHLTAGACDAEEAWENQRQVESLDKLWEKAPPFVAWALIDAVGYLFSSPSDGPWRRSDYPGFDCARCGHDRAHHRPVFRTHRNGIRGRYGPCVVTDAACTCRRYRAAKTHPFDIDPREASGTIG